MRAEEKMTAMDEVARLVVNYRIPAAILRDVNQRVDDWKKSISYQDDNDPYLWQQVKYLRNYLKQVNKYKKEHEKTHSYC